MLKKQRAIIKWNQTEYDRPQPDWYWQQIKLIAKETYAGLDLEIALTPSWQMSGDRDARGFSLGATVPIYSKEKKLARYKEARSFLDEGAKMCAQLETALRSYLIYQQSYSAYEMLAESEGSAVFEKLIQTQIKIVQAEAEITQSHRQLENFVAPFSGKSDIQSWEKVVPAKDGK